VDSTARQIPTGWRHCDCCLWRRLPAVCIVAILNWTRQHTGNQCSSINVGLTSSRKSRAAAFCACCSEATVNEGRLVGIELQLSNLLRITAEISCFTRLPDIVVGGLRSYRDSSSFFYLFSSAALRVRWTELNRTGYMLGSECDWKMHVRNLGYPLPLKLGGPKATFFRRLRNLTATLRAYIFGMEHDIHNRARALQTAKVSCIPSK